MEIGGFKAWAGELADNCAGGAAGAFAVPAEEEDGAGDEGAACAATVGSGAAGAGVAGLGGAVLGGAGASAFAVGADAGAGEEFGCVGAVAAAATTAGPGVTDGDAAGAGGVKAAVWGRCSGSGERNSTAAIMPVPSTAVPAMAAQRILPPPRVLRALIPVRGPTLVVPPVADD